MDRPYRILAWMNSKLKSCLWAQPSECQHITRTSRWVNARWDHAMATWSLNSLNGLKSKWLIAIYTERGNLACVNACMSIASKKKWRYISLILCTTDPSVQINICLSSMNERWSVSKSSKIEHWSYDRPLASIRFSTGLRHNLAKARIANSV